MVRNHEFTGFSRRVVTGAVALVLLVGMSLSLGAAGAAIVAHKTEAVAPPVRIHLPSVNPHLHLPASVGKAVPVAKRHARSHWHHVWGYTEWATLHRGLGTIEGTIHNAEGQSLSGVRVALRNANGGVFRNPALRHVTFTGEGGTFIMTRVRIGSYRVRATKGKAVSHVNVRVGVGGTTTANMRM
jgi:hypothetical protein